MRNLSRKKYLLLLCILSFAITQAQENIKNYLLLGVDAAENIVSDYNSPVAEGLMYGLTGGWYNSAKVAKPWSISVSLVTNGSFIPSEKETFVLDASRFDNLMFLNGQTSARVPTIVGGTNTLTLIASLDNEDFEFESPEGIGLLDLNLLPTAFLQAKVALPKGTEVGVRIFPSTELSENSKIGLWGFGVQHEISQWITGMDEANWALSALVAYTTINGEYDIAEDNDGFVTGSNQLIDSKLDSWLIEIIGSTNFPIFNVYGGLGFITGTSSTELLGTYNIQTQTQSRSFTDPFAIGNDVSGVRANLGAKVRMGWFSINTDYTFQGYNNFSLGLNFKIR